jgi:dTDP-4-amino-4,6-dideoxygalactose transaminase
VERRTLLADRYRDLLQGLPIALPFQQSDTVSSWHLFVIRLRLDQIRLSHRQVFEALRDKGIGVNLHYIPVHTQPYYQQLGFGWGDFPQAEQYYREAISLPLHYGMTLDEQDYVADCLRGCLR